jgi:hypothetical protein
MDGKTLKVLIYTQSDTFADALFHMGITLYRSKNPGDLIDKIQKYFPEIVVLDFTNEDSTATFKLVNQIKDHPDEKIKKTAIILLFGSIDIGNISSAIQAGVAGFIKINAAADLIYDYITTLYQKVRDVPPERKYVRIQIDPKERIGVRFWSPVNLILIVGRIKDISFGGIAVELVGTYPADSLAIGTELKSMQFVLDGKYVFIDGVVAACLEKFCAIQFRDITPEIKEIISRYIFEKICLYV